MPVRQLLVVLLFFVVQFGYTQQFGALPNRVKLKQINTDTVRVIFPAGLDSTAQRVAAIVHQLQQQYTATIGEKHQKINIVLQNQTTFSNAYVGLGPYRSEFFLNPPQDASNLGAVQWADNLALHEFRHVQQYNNFNVGASKIMGVLFGQEGRAVANAMAVPDWFFEGEAVYNETQLSAQGRGRLPFNFSGYKSLQLGNKNYNYSKLRNGSLKDFVPDHYDLGYLLVAYGREKYGDVIWKKVAQDAAAFKPLIYPFQGAFKKHTGINYQQFVKDALAYYQQQWKQETASSLQFISKTNKTVTHYKYPYAYNNSLIVLKSGYQQIPTFYSLTEAGKETKIAVRDIGYDDYFSHRNGQIVYSAWQPDSRWGYREYSIIKVLDIATKLEQQITTKTKYFSPDISADGQQIVAVDVQPNQQVQLHVLNIEGKVMAAFDNPEKLFFAYPKFNEDASSIFVLARQSNGQMGLLQIDMDTKKKTWLIPPANQILAFPVYENGIITYTASGKQGDEIRQLEVQKGAFSVLANYPAGLYQACWNNGKLYSAAFTANGYRLTEIEVKREAKTNADITIPLTVLYSKNTFSNTDNQFLNTVPNRNFDTKPYKKSTRLFNFHSWRPYYDQPEFSFTIYGQNVLNTLQSELVYTYNENEGSHKIGYDAVYGGFYLQPIFGISQTNQRNAFFRNDTSFFWNEFNARIGLQLPLNLSGGKQYRFFNLSATYNIEDVKWTRVATKFLQPIRFNYLQTRLSYTAQIQRAVQHIYPRVGQSLVLQYRTMVNEFKANQFLASGAFYFPGLAVNHNLVITLATQSRDTMNQYYFGNSFPFSRGYTAIDFPRMSKIGFNYHLPLLYPDWGFGQIFYCQRIRANAFYDYTRTRSLRTGNVFTFGTAGTEIYFDTKWWNQQEVSFGIRYSRLLDREFRGITQPNQWEFIMPVNLFR